MDYERTITRYETNGQLNRKHAQLQAESVFSFYRKPCSDEPEFAGSYMFQFQTTYFPPKIEDELTSKNTYLIDNKNGTYTIVDMDEEKLVLPKNHIMIKSMIEQGFEEK